MTRASEGVAMVAGEPRPAESDAAVAASAAAPRPGRVRLALEAALIGGALAVFCTWGFMGLHGMNARLEAGGHRFLYPATWLDAHIPLRVEWIWPYLSYYPMCFMPIFLLYRMSNLRRIALAYAVEFGVAFLCFYLIPMRMQQPAIVGTGAAYDAMRWLYGIDSGYNIFPSLHTANAVMIAMAFFRLHPRPWGILMWLWALAIMASTVLVKQHYVLDVAAGVALALLADRIAFRGWKEANEREDRRLAASRGAAAPG